MPAKLTFQDLLAEGRQTRDAVATAFKGARWNELEGYFDKARQSDPRDETYLQRMFHAYDGLEVVTMPERTKPDKDWEEWYGQLATWGEAVPGSKTVPVLKINYWVEFAWKARGTGWGHTVTEDGWNKFKERLEEADNIYRQAVPDITNPYPCPMLYYAIAPMAKGMDWKKERAMQEIIIPVTENYPAFWLVYNAVADSQKPKWGGPVGGDYQLYKDVLGRIGGNLAHYIYARLVLYELGKGAGSFRKDLVDWDAYYKGVEAMLQREWVPQSMLRGIFMLADGYGELREIVEIFGEQYPDTLKYYFETNLYGYSIAQWKEVGNNGLKLRKYFKAEGQSFASNSINSIRWHPTLDLFAFTWAYNGVRFISPESGKTLQSLDFPAERSSWEIAFSQDGNYFAHVSSWEDSNKSHPDTLLYFYKLGEDGLVKEQGRTLKLKPQVCKGLVFSPDSKRLFMGVATQKRPNRVRQMGLEYLDWQNAKARPRPFKPRAGAVFELQLTPDNQYIQAALQDVQKFPLDNLKSKGVNETPGMRKTSYTISSRYLPGGNYLAVLSPDPKRGLKTLRLHIYDTKTRKELSVIPLDLGGHMYEHTLETWYDPDMGMWLFAVIGDDCHSLRLWGTDDLRGKAPELVAVHLVDGQEICALSHRPAAGGKPGLLISGTKEGMVAIWETNEDPEKIAE